MRKLPQGPTVRFGLGCIPHDLICEIVRIQDEIFQRFWGAILKLHTHPAEVLDPDRLPCICGQQPAKADF